MDLNQKNNDNQTPLFIVSRSGHLELVKYFLENHRNKIELKREIIEVAQEYSRQNVIEYLANSSIPEFKVDPNITPISMKSIPDIAIEIIDGKWDVSFSRFQKLERAGYNYREVQSFVTIYIELSRKYYYDHDGDLEEIEISCRNNGHDFHVIEHYINHYFMGTL